MGEEISLGNVTLNVIGIAVSAALPLFILRYFKIRDQTRDERTKEAKEAVEKNAEELKRIAKENTVEQREFTVHMMQELEKKYEKVSDRVSEEIKHEKDIAHKQMMVEVRENIISSFNDLSKKVDEITSKQYEMKRNQEAMIANLEHRSDLVNGNVELIRNEILELQEDLDELYEKLDNPSVSEKRNRQRKRRKRRQDIAIDSKTQDVIKKKLLP